MESKVLRYSGGVKKFFYSYHFYRGLRNGIGVFLPAFLVGLFSSNREIALAIATGALCAAVVDVIGPFNHKRNEMLAGVALGFVGLVGAYAAHGSPLILGCMVLVFTFFMAMIAIYGIKIGTIGFAAVFMMIIGVGSPLAGDDALLAVVLFLVGGLWYICFSLTVCKIYEWRMAQQALAECIFATAGYLYTKAAFYDPERCFEDAFQQMLTKQSVVIEKQRLARDMILRHAQTPKDDKEIMLTNLFINVVDLHEYLMSAHTDYEALRQLFAKSDILIFFRDLILKMVEDLQILGLCVSSNRIYNGQVHFRAEIRALEYEIELLKRKDFAREEPEGYAALVSTFRRLWSASRCIERMRRNTDPAQAQMAMERKLNIAFTGFLSHENIRLRRIWDNLRLDSPIFRHALRVTAAMGVAYFLGEFLNLSHGTWIMLTVFIIMKPGYSLTQQKNKDRLYGTLIGCVLSVAILYFSPNHHVLMVLIFLSMVIGYGLVYFHYQLSVVFTCCFVILLLHYQQPITFTLVQERLTDTLIGSLLALLFSRWLPSWEQRSFKRLIPRMLGACEAYARAAMGKLLPADTKPLEYRLARKDVIIHYTNLVDALTRMLREPRSHQWQVKRLNQLVEASYILISHLAAIFPVFEQEQARLSHFTFCAAAQAIIGQLMQPGRVVPLTAEDLRQWTNRLDLAVSEIENETGTSESTRLVAHQLKFLLKTSAKINQLVGMLTAAMPSRG